jgi:hypothetical protein
LNPDAEDIIISEDLLQKQKEHIQGIARLYTALPEQNRYVLTFWGSSRCRYLAQELVQKKRLALALR